MIIIIVLYDKCCRYLLFSSMTLRETLLLPFPLFPRQLPHSLRVISLSPLDPPQDSPLVPPLMVGVASP